MYEHNSEPLLVGKLYRARPNHYSNLLNLNMAARSTILRMNYDNRIQLIKNSSMMLVESSVREGIIPPHCGYIDYNFLIGKHQLMFACLNNPESRSNFNWMVVPLDHWCKVYGS